MSCLLDVNVLLALAWPNHQFHVYARAWFKASAPAGWSTCAVTQIGFIRLSSNPAFTPYAKTPLEATLLLGQMTEHEGHTFIERLPPCSTEVFSAIAERTDGHKQTTDAYLLALARHHGRPLVTFDRRIARYSPDPDWVRVLATGPSVQ